MDSTPSSPGSSTVEQTLDEALRQALICHQAGRWEEAEDLYSAILQLQPHHADAHYNLGVLAVQREQPAVGLPHFKAARDAHPAQGQYWLSYIEALILAGQAQQALRILTEGREHGLLGPAVDDLARRIAATLQPVTERPMTPDASPGVADDDSHGHSPADRPATQPTSPTPRRPDEAPSLDETSAVITSFNAGRSIEAEQLARNLILRFPRHGFGWHALGTVLQARGQCKEALAAKQKAAELSPDDAEVHNNLGVTFGQQGRLAEAEVSYRRAVAIDPDYAEAHYNLGNILQQTDRLDEAEAACRRALALAPEDAWASHNLAAVLVKKGRLVEAEALYWRALAIRPDDADIHNDLGSLLQQQGRLAEAEASLRRALALRPDYEDAYSNLLFVLNYDPDRSAEAIVAAYRDYDARFGQPHRGEWRAPDNDRDRNRRLKVGYVSPDFRRHSARHFLEPLLARHDRTAVEVVAYAELTHADEVTARYRGYVDRWVETVGLSDAELAERIRADRIDILVDLAGHTAGNRLGVFARKPAPVAVSWMGYGYTTGLRAIDYFLTDATSAPAGSEALFAERPWRLATPGYVYRPAPDMGPVSPLPALERGYVTFGTLTRAARINHRTVRVWAALLQRVAGARLVIDSGSFQDPALQDALAARFADHGIDPARLTIGCHSPPWDVLRGLDLGLDCFPHNSGTTLIETLYMGVPFVTLAGRPSVGRLGGAVLEGVGHPEWIARTEEEYLDLAAALAADLPRLAARRAGLRDEMARGPVMDEPGFARKVEAAYRAMWHQWCENHP